MVDLDDHEERIRVLELQMRDFIARERGIIGTITALEKFVLLGLSFAGLIVSVVVLLDHLSA